MLKNILNLNGVKQLEKKSQKIILGGFNSVGFEEERKGCKVNSDCGSGVCIGGFPGCSNRCCL